MYTKIDAVIQDKLKRIVGEENLLLSAEQKEPYAHDEVAEVWHEPEAVARVSTTEQVAEILKLSQAEGFPVTPRGLGQGLSGGAVPVLGGLVLSLERMNRVLEIDEENLMVTVEPGLITGNLHRAVESVGLFYPPDPASLDSCSIGGNIAENAGGPRAIKYGVTKDYVCGLEAVLPDGRVMNLGGKVVKNVTGYSLIQLLVGSEGTLAVVTKILLRLLPLATERVDLLVPFNDFRAAGQTVSDIIKARIVPVALEFMEQDSIRAAERLLEKEVPFDGAAAHLLITLDGNDKARLDADYERIGEICLANQANDVLVADNVQLRDRLWEARKKLIEAVKHMSPQKIMDTQDVVVPRTQLPELLPRIREVAERSGLHIISFGHAGDGNVHVCIVKDVPEELWQKKRPQAAEEIYRLAVSLGGFVTGEHGIGLTRKKFLSLGLDSTQIELMRQVKEDFDPRYLLNPGKIFA
jgi:glycolate oxidase